jgi:hypothetical protein
MHNKSIVNGNWWFRHGRHNLLETNFLCICHCVIYKKHQLQLKREFSRQNTGVGLTLHHLLKSLVISI